MRQRVNTPAFASFDGVTGGMILDLSEEGMSMQSLSPLEAHSIVPLHLSLGEPTAYLETTGYVAWADALGRAGVRFSEFGEGAPARLADGERVGAQLDGSALGGARLGIRRRFECKPNSANGRGAQSGART